MFSGSNLLITGGAFTSTTNVVQVSGFDRLREVVARGAFHDSGERHSPPRCHKETRTGVLNRIINWLNGGNKGPPTQVLWMYARAGVGKSAIAQTFSEKLAAEKRLLAGFIFSRFDDMRNSGGRLIPTIAYQAALNIPGLREVIEAAVDRDPLVLGRSLDVQFTELIIQPIQVLQKAGYFDNILAPRLIILDGLDECKDEDLQVDIVRLISTTLDNHPTLPLKFLICSRKEQHLVIAFESYFTKGLTRLNLQNMLLECYEDIRMFLVDKFAEIKRTHPLRSHIPADWPGPQTLEKLVKNSGGQFLYASTVIKYVENIRRRPPRQLELILSKNPEPFTTIDQLYRDIFATLEDPQVALDILCVALLGNQVLKVRELENFLGLEPGDPELVLGELSSVLSLIREEDFWNPCLRWVKITHASFDDFLRDASRSKELHIDAAQRHAKFARRCVEIIKEPDNPLFQYSYSCLAYHLGFAPLEDQRAIIDDMPLAYIFQDKRRWLAPRDIFKLTLDYFNLAKKDTEFHNFLRHMLQLHGFSLLETYYSDAILTFLLTVIGFVAENNARWNKRLACAVVGMVGAASKDTKAVDKQGLKLVRALDDYEDWFAYLELLWGVVGDKHIPEKYVLNRQRYALSVVACLQYMCCHPTCQCTGPRNCISFSKAFEDRWAHRYKQELTTDLLPFLLEHAEPSENLERFLNQNVSAKKLLQGLITETKLDSAVIAQYLTL